MPQVCDYQGTDYKKNFWEEADRRYEEAAEKMVLAKLLPQSGQSIIDLGAGFGRLTPIYAPRFQKVVVFDYAQDLLDQARAELPAQVGPANFRKIEFKQGDIYHLPFPDQSFAVAVSVRVFHHLEDLPAALAEIKRILKPGGLGIFEFANKRNFLEILRWLARRPNARPFDQAPFARGRLYYNFHPDYVRRHLRDLGFIIESQRSVSNFRLPLFKKILPVGWLVLLDRLFMGPLGFMGGGPSLFLRCRLPVVIK